MKIKIVATGKQLLLTMKETKTVEYEDLCFGDVFEIFYEGKWQNI